MPSPTDPKTHLSISPLTYAAVVALAGIAIGLAANLMDWSTGVVYAVGLSAGALIFLFAFRESLFAPPNAPAEKHRRRRPSPR